MFRRIDQAVIRVVEHCCHWVERHTGVSNFVIARFAAVVWVVGIISMIQWSGSHLRGLWVVFGALMLITLPLNFKVLAKLESDTRRQFTNPEKINRLDAIIRVMMLTGALCSIGTVMLLGGATPADVGGIAAAVHFYTRACQPLPPSHQVAWDKNLVTE